MTIREDSNNWFKMLACVNDLKESSVLINSCTFNLTSRNDFILSHGAHRCLTTQNAGGTSEWSEACSFEVLHQLYGAKLLRTEMEIEYAPGSKITDFSITLFGQHIGVSVTRAMSFKHKFDEAEALRLLSKKLFGVNCASRGVIKAHRWTQSILHIIVQDSSYVDILLSAYSQICSSLRSNTIVLITSTLGNNSFIFNKF